MAPQLAKLAERHGDKVVVLKVDVARQGRMAQEAKVRAIPDTRLLYRGKQLLGKVGGMGFEELEMMVLKHASKLPPVEMAAANGVGSKKEGEAIVPMKADWLPPGVTRE